MVAKNTSLGKSVKEQKLIKNLLLGTPFKFRAKDLDKDTIFENNEKWNENNMKAMEGEIVSEDVINDAEGKEQHFRHIIAPVKDDNEIIGTLGVMVDISGYKQSEIDFRESQEMQKTFFSQAMEGIFKMEFEKPVSIKLPVDEQIKLFYKYCYLSECNESLAKMYGYKSPEKIKGMKLIEFHNDPNDVINVETQKNFINSNYRVYDSETKEVDKEGKVKYYLNSAVGIIENEFLIGIWGTQIDITERKKTEVALKESEERYRRLTEYSPETIAVHSKGIVVYINEAGVKLLGGKVPNDIIGKPVLDFVYPDFKQIVVERIKRSQEEKKHSEILEEKFITLDGRVIDVEVTAIPFVYNGIPSSQVIVKDITELKRDEKIKSAVYKISDLIHSIQTLDELYLSVHQIISGLMPANNFYIALYDEQIGLISFPYFVDEYDEKPSPKKPGRGLTEYVLRTGKPLLASPEVFDDLLIKGEVESIGAVSIDWLGVPLKIKEKVIGILTIQTYTEGIRYTVQEMNILNFISEQIAMSISSKKAEEELLKAKTAAEESSKLKSNLLANMSHELRTPMNGILGFAEILLEDTTDVYTREMIQNIFDSGKRLMRTLNSIMDLSQLEAGSDIINFSEFDLNREIQSIIKSFIPVANQKNLYLNSVLPDSVIINSDKNIIQQIITNLIDNALKFTFSGGVTVEVDKSEDIENKCVTIKVKDTGIGIAKEHQEMIFKEFRQVSEGMGRSYEGSGLGLTLTNKMVQILNGAISVDSPPGIGSTFTIILPLIETNGNFTNFILEDKSQEIETSKIIIDDKIGKLPEVLLAEDNELNIQLIKISLKKLCNIDSTTNAKDAVKMAKTKIYDAILMDINLGEGMDGLQAVKEIRRIPGYNKIPIVAVTGYALKGDKELMLDGGCSDYIPKPFDRETIENMMKKVLFKN